MDKKTNFVVNSINDIQSTIRALDAKFFGTIALFVLPLTEFELIAKSFKGLYSHYPSLTLIIFIFLLIFWLFGIVTSFIGIYGISNPSQRIKGVSKAGTTGLFYLPHIFKFNLISQFFPGWVKSSKNLLVIIEEMKLDANERFKELVFEQVKLVYIRDIKVARQKSSIIFLLLSLILLFSTLILNITI